VLTRFPDQEVQAVLKPKYAGVCVGKRPEPDKSGIERSWQQQAASHRKPVHGHDAAAAVDAVEGLPVG